jgi:hypothetical protein
VHWSELQQSSVSQSSFNLEQVAAINELEASIQTNVRGLIAMKQKLLAARGDGPTVLSIDRELAIGVDNQPSHAFPDLPHRSGHLGPRPLTTTPRDSGRALPGSPTRRDSNSTSPKCEVILPLYPSPGLTTSALFVVMEAPPPDLGPPKTAALAMAHQSGFEVLEVLNSHDFSILTAEIKSLPPSAVLHSPTVRAFVSTDPNAPSTSEQRKHVAAKEQQIKGEINELLQLKEAFAGGPEAGAPAVPLPGQWQQKLVALKVSEADQAEFATATSEFIMQLFDSIDIAGLCPMCSNPSDGLSRAQSALELPGQVPSHHFPGQGPWQQFPAQVTSQSIEVLAKWAFYRASMESITFERGSFLKQIAKWCFRYATLRFLCLPNSSDVLNRDCFRAATITELRLRSSEHRVSASPVSAL